MSTKDLIMTNGGDILDLGNSRVCNVHINDSNNIHLGREIHYYGPLEVRQSVTGLPDTLAARPEVSASLAKAGLMAASSGALADPHAPQSMTLLLPAGSKRLPSRQWWVAGGASVLLLAGILIISLLSANSTEVKEATEEPYNPFNSTNGQNVTLSGKLRIIERVHWLAQPVNHPRFNSTSSYLLVTETGGDACMTEANCKFRVKATQNQDMGMNLSDIAANFVLGGDGFAYEGRSWDTPNRCSLNEVYDTNSICISFVGDFSVKSPTKSQLFAVRLLVEMAMSMGKLKTDYVVYAVRQINPKFPYPGDTLYKLMQVWPNWKTVNNSRINALDKN